MARYRVEPFDIKKPLYVRHQFQGNGRTWLPGMLFDWEHFAIAATRVRSLFNSNYLCHKEEENVTPEETIEAEEAVIAETEEEEVLFIEEETEEVLTVGYSLRHKGGPYWEVINSEGEAQHEKALPKAKAEELMKELNDESSDETNVGGNGD